MFSESLCSEKQKEYIHLNYISFQIIPLRNYTITAVTVKVFGTSPYVIFYKPFQLFRRILNNVSNNTKAPSPQNKLQPGRERMGDAPELSYLFLIRNP
jgi:hypothetical protein